MPPLTHLLSEHTAKIKTMKCGKINPEKWTGWSCDVTCPKCKRGT